MKRSLYNSLIVLTDKSFLLYNAFTDSYLVCKNEVLPLLECPAKEIEQRAPAFYKNLVDGGFWVEDEVDEAERAVEEAMRHCDNAGSYRLIVNPTLNCNFQCWYCYENHSAYTKMSTEMVERVKRFLTRLCGASEMKHLDLSFFGGEPLLYYNDTVRPLIDCMRRCREGRPRLGCHIHFTTNGYLITDTLLEHLATGGEQVGFQITLDGGREDHNKVRFSASGAGSYDRILTNIGKLLTKGMEVVVRINFTAKNLQSLPQIAEDLRTLSPDACHKLSIDFQKVWQEGIDNDNPELATCIEHFRHYFPHVTEHSLRIDGFRSPCYGDLLNECVINYNGDVYKCTARDFTPANRVGTLNEEGEIDWLCPGFASQRLQEKFAKPVCRNCRIFPLCGAGCVQTAMEAGNVCVCCKDNHEKDQAILTRFYYHVVKEGTVGVDIGCYICVDE